MKSVFDILTHPTKKKRAKSEKNWAEYFNDLISREELDDLFSFSDMKHLRHNVSGVFRELHL